MMFIIANAMAIDEKFTGTFTVRITNSMNRDRSNVLVFVPLDKIKALRKDFNSGAFVVFDKDKEISSQFEGNKNEISGISFVLDKLKSLEARNITIKYSKTGEIKHQYPKQTQAEVSHKVNGEWKGREYMGGQFKNVDFLRVPKEHKDHSWFIRYEGPGWESEKVGYRFYLDQRNATDVFGKTGSDLILQQVGLDGFDSYHELQSWGMDVMKTGKSLGIGSIGMWVSEAAQRVEITDSVTCEITSNGNVKSSILTNYYGWKAGDEKLSVESRISIHAGTRLTDDILTLSNDSQNLCTGLVKDEKAKLFTKEGNSTSWGYIATYGKQSLNNDNLGVVVFFSNSNFKGFTSDKLSHVVKLKSIDKKLEYYFASVWEGERDGIKTEAGFLDYINGVAEELANPVKIDVRNR